MVKYHFEFQLGLKHNACHEAGDTMACKVTFWAKNIHFLAKMLGNLKEEVEKIRK